MKDSIVKLIPALRAFARTMHSHPCDADDLVQETLTKAIANIGTFEPGTRLKSWLFTIMRNTFYTRVKTYQREMPGLLDCASSRPVAEPSQEWRIRSLEVDAAIRRLPQGQREVIVMVGLLGILTKKRQKSAAARWGRSRAGSDARACVCWRNSASAPPGLYSNEQGRVQSSSTLRARAAWLACSHWLAALEPATEYLSGRPVPCRHVHLRGAWLVILWRSAHRVHLEHAFGDNQSRLIVHAPYQR